MIEEVDVFVGQLLDTLEETRLDKNTLVIFTSDHGDMLGSHGLIGKGVLLVSFPVPEEIGYGCSLYPL